MKMFRRQRNKGFTLVELIATIAILSIVGGAIASFFIVSQKQYGTGMAETSVQYDAQLVSNQIHDLLIDAQRGVSYRFINTLAENPEDKEGLVLSNEDLISRPYENLNLYVYNKDEYYRIRYVKAEKNVYYNRANKGADMPDAENGELLAGGITAFSVDLSKLAETKTITYSITFTKEESGREYTTNHSVKLRNDILINVSADEVYVPDPPEVKATGIDVYPPSLTLWPGESAKIAAKVTSNVGLLPDQSVVWLFRNLESGESPITDGAGTEVHEDTLFIGSAEEGRIIDGVANRINVYAKKVLADGTERTSGNIEVGVRGLSKIMTETYMEADGLKDSLGSSNSQVDYYTTRGVKVGQENICIDVTGFKGYHIADLVNLGNMEQTIADMGGIEITLEDANGYLDVLNLEEAKTTGQLMLNVRKGIVFAEGETAKEAKVTFTSRRDAGVKETIILKIVPREDVPLIDVSRGWERNGTLDIDLSAIDDRINDQTHIDVHVQFYYFDENGEKKCQDAAYTYGEQDGYDEDSDPEYPAYAVQHQSGTPCELLFLNADNAGPDMRQVLKLRLKAPSVRYTGTFYDKYGNCTTTISGAHVWITYGSYTSEVYDVAIEPVSMEYSLDGIHQTSWDAAGNMMVYAVPVNETKNYTTVNTFYGGAKEGANENYKTYRTYYRLNAGWHVSPAKDAYSLEADKFVCMIDGMSGVQIGRGKDGKKAYFASNYYADGYVKFATGKDEHGYYIDTIIPDSMNQYFAESGAVMSVVYEGNPVSGLSAWNEEKFDRMTGCEFGFKVKFVTDNIKDDYVVREWQGFMWFGSWKNVKYTVDSENLPSTQYCPSQDELIKAGYENDSYFYISPTERYYIRTQRQGMKETYYITFQKYTSAMAGTGRWTNQWKHNGESVIWYAYNGNTDNWEYSSTVFVN